MKKITVTELEQALKGGPSTIQVVDVREPAEYDSERLEGARSLPLSSLRADQAGLSPQEPLYVLCRSGARACQAAEAFERAGYRDVRVLDGGLRAWVEAGRPVLRRSGGVWSLERQVRFAAGLLVLIGTALGLMVHFYWLGLAAFVGAGLVFAAVTDTCGMAMLLARMPWNQRPAGQTCRRP
ncbi:MAG: Inner membrane protein YgaP [Candidatus Omnitrophica bacterium]|nr:Inner membrane protein YgaP [Candidatus Omnitrophota bacterium]